jgi:PHD/YefM family antitoxin component YafN of YafNO toxin-antitoxin module
MNASSLRSDPNRIDEPTAAQEYSDVLTQVASQGRPLIVRRNGEDLAAVIPLEHLAMLQEVIARADLEELAAEIDWDRLVRQHKAPQQWLDNDDDPFEPAEEPAK